jgi:hypothetical protein
VTSRAEGDRSEVDVGLRTGSENASVVSPLTTATVRRFSSEPRSTAA